MNDNARNLITPNTKLSTQEVLAQIRAAQAARGSGLTGTDYSRKWADTASSEQGGADVIELGATALNNKDGIKNFKAVAPVAHPSTASSGDDDITLENKALAANTSEPMEKAVVDPLRSPTDEQDVQNTCGAHDDADPTIDQSDHAEDDNEMFDPEFYKVSVDFFDNGDVINRTRYTAKLSIQKHQDDDPADNDKLFANFYSRSRQFKSFIEQQECWDEWYDHVWGIFQETCERKLDFKITPRISILKERSFANGKSTYDAIVHTACILYQAHGQVPILIVAYGLWVDKLPLDAKFQAKDAKAPHSKGYYVDPARAALEPQKQAKGMKVKTKRDFSR
ncbi:hypothetical protein DFI02_102682 [Rhizobium sp. PP-F2F-G20b]|nr:hypothetical protein DFI02_102682 [Rhizobium sp. PP-F2F-G20b]